jgi:hypothetical protein
MPAILIFLLSSISWSGGAMGQDSVRKVDISQTPQMKQLAERARQIGNEMYPKVIELLGDGKIQLPERFDIVFRKNLSKTGELGFPVGYVKRRGTTIYLDAELIAAEPESLERVLVHEMAHVAQRYSFSVPPYWWEGMADYVVYKLSLDGTNCPVCSGLSWHFQSGYACTAAFLIYIDKTYGSNAVHQLNMDFRRVFYSDKFFAQVTGRNLDDAWENFKKTDGYTPGAARTSQLYKSKGYSLGEAIKNQGVLAQIKRQPGGEFTLEAQTFITRLVIIHQLPGFRKDENAKVLAPAADQSTNDSYPVTRRFDTSKGGEPYIYNYLVVRGSKHSDWKLQRIWRTDRDGKVVEEYALPK